MDKDSDDEDDGVMGHSTMSGNHAAFKLLGQRKAKAKEKKSTLMDKDSDDEDDG